MTDQQPADAEVPWYRAEPRHNPSYSKVDLGHLLEGTNIRILSGNRRECLPCKTQRNTGRAEEHRAYRRRKAALDQAQPLASAESSIMASSMHQDP